ADFLYLVAQAGRLLELQVAGMLEHFCFQRRDLAGGLCWRRRHGILAAVLAHAFFAALAVLAARARGIGVFQNVADALVQGRRRDAVLSIEGNLFFAPAIGLFD